MVLLHAAHAVRMSSNKILIRTVDTDVVVLAVAYAAKMGIEELWIAFRGRKHFRYIAAHRIATHFGPDMCAALPFFLLYLGVIRCFILMLTSSNFVKCYILI